MTKTRNLADLLDNNGDVKLANLDNVPASNDASALTTGTLPIDRIANGDITLDKLSATGTKDATTFLRGDNTFASAGGANTPTFYAQKNVNQNILNFTSTKMEINSEIIDTAGNYDNVTNYRFTPTTAGKYFIFASCLYQNFTANKLFSVSLFKNGSGIQSVVNSSGNVADDMSAYIGLIVEANGTSDYFEAFTFHSAGVTLVLSGGFFGGYRIIE